MSHNCSECTSSFSTIGTLNQHLIKFHNIDKRKSNIKCNNCNLKFPSIKSLINHLKDHQIKIEEIKIKFKTKEEFIFWKNEEQKLTNSNYYCLKRGNVENYYCSRNGFHDNKPILDRKRQLNLKGSCKLDSYCTSTIKLNDKLECSYTKTHYGHLKEICHLRMDEKLEIASQLSLGIDPNIILKNFKSDSNSSLQQHLINKNDLRSIKNHFKINIGNNRRHSDEVESLKLAVKDHQESVILFKNQGELNDQFPGLNEDDFLLGYAQKDQVCIAQSFLNQPNSIIKMDATHGLNTCDFQLIIILTLDRSKKGFPFAFLISNRETYVVLKYFLIKLRQKYGEFPADYFMSDDADQYFTSWFSVFGISPSSNDTLSSISVLSDLTNSSNKKSINRPIKLLCAWHIDRSFRKNILQKIKDSNDKELIYYDLYNIRHALTEEKFNNTTFVFFIKNFF